MIGDRIREERARLGLTQTAFAELCGSSKRTVSKWEGNQTAPTAEQLAALAAAGADVLYIVTGRRTEPPILQVHGLGGPHEVREPEARAPTAPPFDEAVMREQYLWVEAKAAHLSAATRWEMLMLLYEEASKTEAAPDERTRERVLRLVGGGRGA